MADPNLHNGDGREGDSLDSRTCPICAKILPTHKGMVNHVNLGHRDHTEARIRLGDHYDCPYCNRPFEHPEYVHPHVSRRHKDQLAYKIEDLRRNGGNNVPVPEGQPDEDIMPSETGQEDQASEPESTRSVTETVRTTNEILQSLVEVAETPAGEDVRPHCEMCGEMFDDNAALAEHMGTTDCGNENDGPAISERDGFSTPSPEEPKRKHCRLEDSTTEGHNETDVENTLPHKTPRANIKDQSGMPSTSKIEVSPAAMKMDSQNVKREAVFVDRRPRTYTIAATVGSNLDKRVPNEILQAKKEDLNATVSTQNVPLGQLELSSLTLVVGMFKRATCNPNELVATLDEDVLITASENSSNTTIILEGYSPLSLTQDGKEIWKKCKKAVFSMESDNGTMTPWTAIFFGNQRPPEDLHGNVFERFQDVEAVLSEYATNRGMNLVNIMKFGTEGLFSILSICFSQKTIEYNHHH